MERIILGKESTKFSFNYLMRCLNCGCKFKILKYRYERNENGGRFCSNSCKSLFYTRNFPKILSEATRKRVSQNNCRYWLGKKRPEQNKENNPYWKGEDVSYSGIHKWIKNHRQHTENCEICGISEKFIKLEWANKDHKYRRNLEDYLSLCPLCHRRYDKANNQVSHFYNSIKQKV